MSDIGASSDPDLGRLLGLVRRWWWLLVAAAVIGGWASYNVGTRTAAQYEAKATVLVGPLEGESNILRAAGQEAQTLTSVAVSRPVLVAAQRRAGAAAEGQLTAERVGATADEVTRLLTVVARAHDPRHAAVIANAIVSELPNAGGRLANVSVVDPAQPPSSAVGSGAKVLAIIGSLAVVLLLLMILLVHDYFRGRVTREADLTELTGAAHLTTVRRSPRNSLLFAFNGHTAPGTQFRLLAGRITLAAADQGSTSAVISSADAGETSADIAGNLAAALAADGRRVVLVDADADAREVTRLLGFDDRLGLGELLASNSTKLRIADVAIDQGSHLRVIPAGSPDGHRAIDARAAERVLKLILEEADAVVISAGPAATSAAALAWARSADGTVLLARRGGSRRDAVIQAKAAITDVGGRLMGTVLAERERRSPAQTATDTVARLRAGLQALPIARREGASEAAS